MSVACFIFSQRKTRVRSTPAGNELFTTGSKLFIYVQRTIETLIGRFPYLIVLIRKQTTRSTRPASRTVFIPRTPHKSITGFPRKHKLTKFPVRRSRPGCNAAASSRWRAQSRWLTINYGNYMCSAQDARKHNARWFPAGFVISKQLGLDDDDDDEGDEGALVEALRWVCT